MHLQVVTSDCLSESSNHSTNLFKTQIFLQVIVKASDCFYMQVTESFNTTNSFKNTDSFSKKQVTSFSQFVQIDNLF